VLHYCEQHVQNEQETRHSEQFDWQGNLKFLDTIFYAPAIVSNFATGHVTTTSWCIATKTGSH
jgi:hypothetical protein